MPPAFSLRSSPVPFTFSAVFVMTRGSLSGVPIPGSAQKGRGVAHEEDRRWASPRLPAVALSSRKGHPQATGVVLESEIGGGHRQWRVCGRFNTKSGMEGFEVVMRYANGRDVRDDREQIGSYNRFATRASGALTVADWKRLRSYKTYQGLNAT